MIDDSYRQVPYLTVPMAQTHPDRLASVAILWGMSPAPVDSCRVLEIGCGSGGNLIPMAYFLPGSRFTGVDLEQAAIAEGQRAVSALRLANLDLIAMDLHDIGPAMGEFDYIVAHGVYSWVPDSVRERLLAVCRERLAEQGVALISYNALPGRQVPMMLREMMLYHTRNCADPAERVGKARELLRMILEAQSLSHVRHAMIDQEIGHLLALNDGWLAHDDLGPVNDAFYFRDFMAHASRHSLQYLGEAEVHRMFDVSHALDWTGDDILEREQYLDFLSLRRFRQTLLCRSEIALDRTSIEKRMDNLFFASPARQSGGEIKGFNSVRIGPLQERLTRVAAEMREAYPLPVGFERLLAAVGDCQELRGILLGLIRSGFAELRVHDLASRRAVGTHPRSSRLARWESARGAAVTYCTHTVLQLDGLMRSIIDLLDGTRGFDEIASALALAEDVPLEEIRARLPRILSRMAATGLLEA